MRRQRDNADRARLLACGCGRARAYVLAGEYRRAGVDVCFQCVREMCASTVRVNRARQPCASTVRVNRVRQPCAST
eukprot:1173241-Pleurochrysis_carterae.AAC.1